ncbi:MAG: hypothetical protein V2I65_16915 [Paracoccaceae bacterium]|jgi:hypothetical protein|nr:hypothetical protein [Paracoccaceae bacterium]
MRGLHILGAPLVAVALACAGGPANAQEAGALTTRAEVRSEIEQAMEAIAAYSEQERDEAVAEARAALDRLDAEIARREQALRENWAEMSDEARETARTRLEELRAARNRLGERYGALQSGASEAWDELTAGFSDAWNAFSETWSDEPAPSAD